MMIILLFLCSEWYLNGNYVVVLVSIGIILPLSMLKNLGKTVLGVRELVFVFVMSGSVYLTQISSHRVSWLHQRLLSVLYGVLPGRGAFTEKPDTLLLFNMNFYQHGGVFYVVLQHLYLCIVS